MTRYAKIRVPGKEMKITREQVLRVAEMAHLELTEAEVDTYSRQLDSILTYIEKLNQLDTSHVEPMAQVFSGVGNEVGNEAGNEAGKQAGKEAGSQENTSVREDVARASDVGPAVLDGAPDASRPYFRVPKVIER
ncbi:MAG TPA: Asp-tRNA(Asn)/Glu-tRNA(Gln) amidotransferase subunit GatC [Candidatus Acidoferrales bacterium]|nr:Asp-tRNA(Asn)/Glu-tRNA(Gln) amidotransferase subunit GatC [Candidatus Acidoferrales bacterium]